MKLTVKPLKQKDAGRSLAAVDKAFQKEHNISNGDYVFVENPNNKNKKSIVRVWPGYDEDTGKGIIRVDGKVRKETDVSIDDNVEIKKADIGPAESITVSIPKKYNIRGNLESIIKQKINGNPVKLGQNLPFSLDFGTLGAQKQEPLPLKVTGIEPSSPAIVRDETEINIEKQEKGKVKSVSTVDNSGVAYEDIGGLTEELEQVREMIELPMRHPELFQRVGIDPPKGVLLHGPPGTGKTLIAKAVANEVNSEFYTISGPEIMSKYYGESEEQLRDIFEEAENNSPAIIFMDELDSIASQRGESGGDVEKRVVAQLLSLMDGLEEREDVIVIGATNRVDAIDPALRRGGRFDREIEVSAPDQKGRREIFDVHTRSMPLSEDVAGDNLDEYAEKTHGFVGADIESLCKEAAMTAIRRVKPTINLDDDTIDADVLESIEIEQEDMKNALRDIEPSALREVFVEVPDMTWDDIGGLENTKERMREIIQWPLEYGTIFNDMGLSPAKGVLMYGPPGTGKTLMAKAVANESDSNFISIKGPELLNKYVGESEKGVREIFEKARSNAPTIVFFDEIDAIASERGNRTGDSGVGERVVSQLLTELDGLENLEDVVVIATTNRPDLIDSALLRPGRLDRHIHVPVPDVESRKEVLRVHTENLVLSDDVDLVNLAERTSGFVGADIEALCREATMSATRELIQSLTPEEAESKEYKNTTKEVEMRHFVTALNEVQASVTEETREEYEKIEERFEKNSATQQNTGENVPKRGFQ